MTNTCFFCAKEIKVSSAYKITESNFYRVKPCPTSGQFYLGIVRVFLMDTVIVYPK